MKFPKAFNLNNIMRNVMLTIPFTKGLHQIGDGIYAYLQPDGSWGLNNAGLIVSENQALLVDTLYDYKRTGDMLAEIQKTIGPPVKIQYLINTHSNGDHYFGNGLVEGAKIISSEICAKEMKAIPPFKMAFLMKIWWLLGKGGRYLHKSFKLFDFGGIRLVLPHQVFQDSMILSVGKKRVELLEVRDAHTASDIMAYLPDDKIIFCSDLLFSEGTPVVWTKGVQSWIDALNKINSLDVDRIVPGHGPVTDKNGVSRLIAYFEYIYSETKKRFSKNMSILDASLDIDLKEYNGWGDPERLVTTVHAIYQELNPTMKPLSAVNLFAMMYDYKSHIKF